MGLRNSLGHIHARFNARIAAAAGLLALFPIRAPICLGDGAPSYPQTIIVHDVNGNPQVQHFNSLGEFQNSYKNLAIDVGLAHKTMPSDVTALNNEANISSTQAGLQTQHSDTVTQLENEQKQNAVGMQLTGAAQTTKGFADGACATIGGDTPICKFSGGVETTIEVANAPDKASAMADAGADAATQQGLEKSPSGDKAIALIDLQKAGQNMQDGVNKWSEGSQLKDQATADANAQRQNDADKAALDNFGAGYLRNLSSEIQTGENKDNQQLVASLEANDPTLKAQFQSQVDAAVNSSLLVIHDTDQKQATRDQNQVIADDWQSFLNDASKISCNASDQWASVDKDNASTTDQLKNTQSDVSTFLNNANSLVAASSSAGIDLPSFASAPTHIGSAQGGLARVKTTYRFNGTLVGTTCPQVPANEVAAYEQSTRSLNPSYQISFEELH